jgi:hypothetical protein
LGCRSNRDLIEAELRSKDSDLREVRDELYRCEAYNQALQREMCALRGGNSGYLSPELAAQTYTVQSIVLGRGTGGYDGDNCPGDEALQVIFEPRDPDGHAIKAPGTVEVQALEITKEGTKKPLSSWIVPPEQLRRSWRSGLISTGYSLILPWKNWPTTEKLRVVVRLTLPDGRQFEADKDVTVKLAPGKKGSVPALETGNPADVDYPYTDLPPPRKIEGPGMDGGWNAPPQATIQQAAKPASSLTRAAWLMPPVPLR